MDVRPRTDKFMRSKETGIDPFLTDYITNVSPCQEVLTIIFGFDTFH